MAQQKSDEVDPPPVTHFLKDAIKTRLELQLTHHDRWAEALALLIDPKVAPLAAAQFGKFLQSATYIFSDNPPSAAHLVDDIWY